MFNTNVYSQGESNIWCFGQYAGLDFNYSKPKSFLTGRVGSIEGSATICNKFGRLLFATDGFTVWDSTNKIMPNGGNLGQFPQSPPTQSSLIVPFPQNNYLYYLFTIEVNGGLSYSIIDMRLNFGKGDVIKDKKKITVLTPTCHKVTGIKHSNNIDYWIITHKFNTDTIFTYLLTDTGLLKNPVKSATKLKVHSFGTNWSGYMKLSSDGKKIAYANYNLDSAVIADFNLSTGKVTNPIIFYTNDAYGVEFSPKSNFLYISEKNKDRKIVQFSAKSRNLKDFLTSRTVIDTNFNDALGSLQLGPDGKIYLSENNSNYIHVIQAPDSVGLNCRFQKNYIYLGGKTCWLGFPNFVQDFLKDQVIVNVKKKCPFDSTFFSVSSKSEIDSIEWHFGDSTSNKANYFKSNSKTAFHIYNSYGTYVIRVKYFRGGIVDSVHTVVSLLEPKADFSTKDVCEFDSAKFTNNSTFQTNFRYNWIFGDGQFSSNYSTSHLYQVNGGSRTFNVSLILTTEDGCSDTFRNTVTVNAKPVSDFNYKIDGSNITLTAIQSGNMKYNWYYGNHDSAFTIIPEYKFNIKNPNQYLFCLRTTNLSNCSSTTCKNILVSINENDLYGNLIYPNPNNGLFMLTKSNPLIDCTIKMYNVLGEEINYEIKYINQNSYEIFINQPIGIYLLEIKTRYQVYYQKVIVRK